MATAVFNPKDRDAQIRDLFGIIEAEAHADQGNTVKMDDEGDIPVEELISRVRAALQKLPEQDVYDLKMLIVYCGTH